MARLEAMAGSAMARLLASTNILEVKEYAIRVTDRAMAEIFGPSTAGSAATEALVQVLVQAAKASNKVWKAAFHTQLARVFLITEQKLSSPTPQSRLDGAKMLSVLLHHSVFATFGVDLTNATEVLIKQLEDPELPIYITIGLFHAMANSSASWPPSAVQSNTQRLVMATACAGRRYCEAEQREIKAAGATTEQGQPYSGRSNGNDAAFVRALTRVLKANDTQAARASREWAPLALSFTLHPSQRVRSRALRLMKLADPSICSDTKISAQTKRFLRTSLGDLARLVSNRDGDSDIIGACEAAMWMFALLGGHGKETIAVDSQMARSLGLKRVFFRGGGVEACNILIQSAVSPCFRKSKYHALEAWTALCYMVSHSEPARFVKETYMKTLLKPLASLCALDGEVPREGSEKWCLYLHALRVWIQMLWWYCGALRRVFTAQGPNEARAAAKTVYDVVARPLIKEVIKAQRMLQSAVFSKVGREPMNDLLSALLDVFSGSAEVASGIGYVDGTDMARWFARSSSPSSQGPVGFPNVVLDFPRLKHIFLEVVRFLGESSCIVFELHETRRQITAVWYLLCCTNEDDYFKNRSRPDELLEMINLYQAPFKEGQESYRSLGFEYYARLLSTNIKAFRKQDDHSDLDRWKSMVYEWDMAALTVLWPCSEKEDPLDPDSDNASRFWLVYTSSTPGEELDAFNELRKPPLTRISQLLRHVFENTDVRAGRAESLAVILGYSINEITKCTTVAFGRNAEPDRQLFRSGYGPSHHAPDSFSRPYYSLLQLLVCKYCFRDWLDSKASKVTVSKLEELLVRPLTKYIKILDDPDAVWGWMFALTPYLPRIAVMGRKQVKEQQVKSQFFKKRAKKQQVQSQFFKKCKDLCVTVFESVWRRCIAPRFDRHKALDIVTINPSVGYRYAIERAAYTFNLKRTIDNLLVRKESTNQVSLLQSPPPPTVDALAGEPTNQVSLLQSPPPPTVDALAASGGTQLSLGSCPTIVTVSPARKRPQRSKSVAEPASSAAPPEKKQRAAAEPVVPEPERSSSAAPPEKKQRAAAEPVIPEPERSDQGPEGSELAALQSENVRLRQDNARLRQAQPSIHEVLSALRNEVAALRAEVKTLAANKPKR